MMYLSVLITSLVLTISAREADYNCKQGWTLHDQSCFRMYKIDKNYNDARAYCLSQQAHLAIIPDRATSDFITKEFFLPHNIDILIGLNDITHEGRFEWEDSDVPVDFTNWITGEPNDSLNIEDCVRIWTGHNGQWNDHNCNTESSFLCQRSAIKRELCGQNFTIGSDNGLILSLGYPSPYPNYTLCTWYVNVGQDSLISFVFYPPFELENSTGCEHDSVKMFDILPNGDEELRSIWCASSLPPPQTSSTSKIKIEFTTDSSVVGKGFSASWSKVAKPCYNVLKGIKGEITPPNYPSAYPDNIKCIWDIIAPDSQFIELEFNSTFNLGTKGDKSCDHDRIEVFDVFGNTSLIRRGQWCGTDIPPLMTSFGSKMVVVFQTDYNSDTSGPGFIAVWRAVRDCGGAFHGNQGYIMSPNYFINVTSNLTCAWSIDVPVGFHINLSFDPSIRESHCGVVEINDYSENSTVTNLPQGQCDDNSEKTQLTSTGHHIFILFHPAQNFTKGFFVSWNSVCGDIYNKNQGYLTTPNYPLPYGHYLDCRWEINALDNHIIMIQFDRQFDIESSDNGCKYDYVEIFDSVDGQLVSEGKLCGQNAPAVLTSYFSKMVVVFHSDGDKNGKGFLLSWNSEHTCGDVYSGSKGNLSFPNINAHYQRNMSCRWEILVDPWFYSISLYFHRQIDIGNDRLQVSGLTRNGSVAFQTDVTGASPRTLTFDTSRLVLRFNSFNGSPGTGFDITWDAACGGVFDNLQGNFTSPNYGGDYPTNIDCEWQITSGDTYHNINLYFETPFEVEAKDDNSCGYDYVEVLYSLRNGTLVSKGRFCSHNPPPAVISSYSTMVIRFHSDEDKPGKGFSAWWDKACGEVYHSNKGEIKSPDFPRRYPDNFNCRWEIQVDEGHRVRLSFKHPFIIEESRRCSADFVEVHDISDNEKLTSKGRWCGLRMPPELKSSHSKMVVVFHSDNTKNNAGFHAVWDSVASCRRTFGKDVGVLMSPNYPNQYPENQNCRWEIKPLGGVNVVLQFDPLFDLEGGSDCAWDYVQVLRGNVSIGQWCGNVHPQPVSSNGENLVVVFKSDKSNSRKGFFASWRPS